MKKKVVSLMLVLAMTVSMTACGNKNNAADDANAVEDTEAGTESGSSEEAVAPANYEEASCYFAERFAGRRLCYDYGIPGKHQPLPA